MKKAKAVVNKAGPLNAVHLQTVRELARIATEFDLSEVEADPTGHIRVARRVEARGGGAGPSASLQLMPSPAAEKKADDKGLMVTSPFVGTFYRSPSPDAAVFTDVGQTVRKGQVVCIVEAMKLMNEIESDFDGKVIEVLAQNGDHVEYGQPLFRIQK